MTIKRHLVVAALLISAVSQLNGESSLQKKYWTPGTRIASSAMSHHFNHRFHWPRHWCQWDIPPYYFWWGSKIYIYAPRAEWTSTWVITNQTSDTLLICTAEGIAQIPSQATVAINRNGTKRFQIYSLHTGERMRVHTCTPEIVVRYSPAQDYLIVTKQKQQ